MSNKQARLIAAVRDKQEALGYTQREMAMACGTSQGMLSQALCGRAQMSEEKWKMLCEKLGLDYNEIVDDLPAPVQQLQKAEKVEPAEDCKPCESTSENSHLKAAPEGTDGTSDAEYKVDPGTVPFTPSSGFAFAADDFETIRQERQEKLMRLAGYAEGRLQEDIHHGMDVDLGKLWQILDAIHAIKEGDIR